MSFSELVKKRCSIRSYLNKPVEKEKLDYILEAAHVAPTAANLQPVRILAVHSKDGLEKVKKSADIYGAPIALIICADKTTAWVRPFDSKSSADIDASILTDHMMLAAAEQGLGSVWICYFKPDVLKQELDIPDNLEPVNILALGYTDNPEGDPDRHNTARIPLHELVIHL